MRVFKYRILDHILFWIAIFSFYTVLPSLPTKEIWPAVRDNLTYLPLDIITTYLVILLLIPHFLLKKKYLIFFSGFILVIGGNVFFSIFIKYNLHPYIGIWVYPYPMAHEIFYSLSSNFIIVGSASALKLIRHSFKIQLSRAELEKRSIQSELGTLRAQVNPHFLFNVLNNIDSLIFEDREKASNAIFLLSKIMRFMFRESNQEKVPLEREISYIEDYLELARLSFQSPNFLQFRITGNVTGKTVPPLLFIPIIENAVKHCNKQSDTPGIVIDFSIEEQHIHLFTFNYTRKNNFSLPGEGSGMGLKNVEKRINLLYGNQAILKTNQLEDTFEVHLKVPLA